MSTSTARLRRACALLAITALVGASGCGSYGDKSSNSSSQGKATSTPAKKSGGNGY
jgi:hypothetical protein